MANTKLDIIGKTFSRLTVLKQFGKSKNGHLMFLCKCECGNEKLIIGSSLVYGDTKSCGCLSREKAYIMGINHGIAMREISRNPKRIERKRIKNAFSNMLNRCFNPKDMNYKNYGGRGVKVCDVWSNDPESFIEWSLSNGYSGNLTIDRIDNDGDYTPNNCKWSTTKEQSRNKRSNVFATIGDETKILNDWATEFNTSPKMIGNKFHQGKLESYLKKLNEKKEVQTA